MGLHALLMHVYRTHVTYQLTHSPPIPPTPLTLLPVTATNVLIKKKCACPDVLHCRCPRRYKCEVRIADFDALRKTTQYSTKAANLPEVTTSAMTPDRMKAVLGTMGYRALEVSE